MNIIILKNFPFFWVNENDFKKIDLNGHELYLTNGSCWSIPSTCIRDQNSISIQKKKIIFFILENEEKTINFCNNFIIIKKKVY